MKNGFYAGSEADGKKVYVGRVTDASGNFLPAKIIPDYKQSFYEGNGAEQSSDKIEFLSNSEGYEWVKSSGGASVPDAVTISGFYVGRGVYNGNTVVGRVDLNTKNLVATWGGNALNLPEYEVLVFKPQGITKPISVFPYLMSINVDSLQIAPVHPFKMYRVQLTLSQLNDEPSIKLYPNSNKINKIEWSFVSQCLISNDTLKC